MWGKSRKRERIKKLYPNTPNALLMDQDCKKHSFGIHEIFSIFPLHFSIHLFLPYSPKFIFNFPKKLPFGHSSTATNPQQSLILPDFGIYQKNHELL